MLYGSACLKLIPNLVKGLSAFISTERKLGVYFTTAGGDIWEMATKSQNGASKTCDPTGKSGKSCWIQSEKRTDLSHTREVVYLTEPAQVLRGFNDGLSNTYSPQKH